MLDRVQHCSNIRILLLENGETHCKNIDPALLLQSIRIYCLHVCSMQILEENRPGWKLSKPAPFKFQSDRITATLEEKYHVRGDWRADFTGASEVC